MAGDQSDRVRVMTFAGSTRKGRSKCYTIQMLVLVDLCCSAAGQRDVLYFVIRKSFVGWEEDDETCMIC